MNADVTRDFSFVSSSTSMILRFLGHSILCLNHLSFNSNKQRRDEGFIRGSNLRRDKRIADKHASNTYPIFCPIKQVTRIYNIVADRWVGAYNPLTPCPHTRARAVFLTRVFKLFDSCVTNRRTDSLLQSRLSTTYKDLNSNWVRHGNGNAKTKISLWPNNRFDYD